MNNIALDPFTRTPGIAGEAFIDMHHADVVVSAFENENSYKYVYKIVGLRGSGKSVEYSKIIKHFKNSKGWLVYTLSAAGNPINTLIAHLSNEAFIDNTKYSVTESISSSVDGGIGIIGGNVSKETSKKREYNNNLFSVEATLTNMVKTANDNGYRVLVGVDDISKTQNMVEFLSVFGSMLLNSYKIYLVCTGLNKNIEDFSNEENLTFFKRSDLIEIGKLDRYEVADMYQKLLNIESNEASKLSKFVKGYAYAYQVLGSLYFNKEENEKLDNLIPRFNKIIFRDSYDLIWKSLSNAEKDLVKCILKTNSGIVNEVKTLMNNPNNFPVLRSRLENKHIVNTEDRGKITIELPQFKEFIELWEE